MHAYQKINGDLKTDFFDSKKIVVLYGAEDFLVSVFAKKIKSRYINGEGEALDCEEINLADGLGGEAASEELILSKAAPLPMLSAKRVIILSGLESQGSLAVKTLAEKLPAHSIVIYAIKKPTLKVGKAPESVVVYDFARLDERTFGAFVVDRLAKFRAEKRKSQTMS
jgi:DNA polymerase III delta subunit